MAFGRKRGEVIRVRVTQASFLRWQQALALVRAGHEFRNQEEFLMSLLDGYERGKSKFSPLIS